MEVSYKKKDPRVLCGSDCC